MPLPKISGILQSPLGLLAVLVIGSTLVLAAVYLSRPDGETARVGNGPESTGPVAPSAENVAPTFHAQMMTLRREVEASPRDTSLLMQLARLHHDAHQMEEAADLYERVLEIAPGHRQAWIDLALSYAELGRWDDAEEATTTLLDLYPDDPAGLYNLGAIRANLDDFDEAQRIWERLAASTDDDQIARRAESSLEQLASLRRPEAGAASEAGDALPSGHPPIAPQNYEPVIAGQ